MSAMRPAVLIGHEWEANQRRVVAWCQTWLKCDRQFMASLSRVGRGIHSSGSLPTRSASLVRFHHARPWTWCHEVRPGVGPLKVDVSASPN
jgi:hypothetical protein